MVNETKIYTFAESFPQFTCWKGPIEESFRACEEAERVRILSKLPTLETRISNYSTRLLEIHNKFSEGPRKQRYDPAKYFNEDERKSLELDLENLDLLVIKKPKKDSNLNEVYIRNPILETGEILIKQKKIYMHPDSQAEEDLRDNWKNKLFGCIATTTLFGIQLAVLPRLLTSDMDYLTSVGFIGSIYGGLIASGGMGLLGGNYLGEKFGLKLGGKIPLEYYQENPFGGLAKKMESRVSYIKNKLVNSKTN